MLMYAPAWLRARGRAPIISTMAWAALYAGELASSLLSSGLGSLALLSNRSTPSACERIGRLIGSANGQVAQFLVVSSTWPCEAKGRIWPISGMSSILSRISNQLVNKLNQFLTEARVWL